MPKAVAPDIPATPADVNHPAPAAVEFAAALPSTTDEDAAPKRGYTVTTYIIVLAKNVEKIPVPAASGNPTFRAKS